MKRLLLIVALLVALPLQAADDFKDIKWEALVPKGWDPTKDLRALDLAKLQDNDPRAMEVLEKIKQMWDSAPTEPSLAGTRIRLPGFAIPLENKAGKVSEFLLVPYFGACIHSPPPPANQIIHVLPRSVAKNVKAMDPVWISGTLASMKTDSYMGAAGYRVEATVVEPYVERPR